MEKSISNFVSFGIGAFESARQSVETLLKNLETEVNALIAQGETEDSENVVRVRAAVTDASTQLMTFSERLKLEYSELNGRVQETLTAIQAHAKDLAASLPKRSA
ncbi:MAG TPA: hypothetical protein PLY93_02505 [Turneriella sp.]|nr:hypothetical protein [Turneriella sp.]